MVRPPLEPLPGLFSVLADLAEQLPIHIKQYFQ
jgi:hypothetical protein